MHLSLLCPFQIKTKLPIFELNNQSSEKTFGHAESLLPARRNRCNKHHWQALSSCPYLWANVLQACLGLDFIVTQRCEHLSAAERCSTLIVCLLRFRRENSCADRSHRLHTLGAGKRTVLTVHVFPVAIHQLSRAERSCMYVQRGLLRNMQIPMQASPAQCWRCCAVLMVCCTKELLCVFAVG